MKIDNNLSEVFNMELTEKVSQEYVTEAEEFISSQNGKVESDYDKTRFNLHHLLSQGQDALNHALEIAKQSEHPRAFEVVGNLMKQLADINNQLMELHTQKQKLDAPSKLETKNITNNSIFVGSTTELNKLINKMNTGE